MNRTFEVTAAVTNPRYQGWGGNDSWDLTLTDGKLSFKIEGYMCIGMPPRFLHENQLPPISLRNALKADERKP